MKTAASKNNHRERLQEKKKSGNPNILDNIRMISHLPHLPHLPRMAYFGASGETELPTSSQDFNGVSTGLVSPPIPGRRWGVSQFWCLHSLRASVSITRTRTRGSEPSIGVFVHFLDFPQLESLHHSWVVEEDYIPSFGIRMRKSFFQ